MKTETITKKENKSLNRTELELLIESNSCPSKKEVIETISAEKSCDPESIHIKTIKGKFGTNKFLVICQIYHNKEHKHKTIIKTQKQIAAEKKVLKEAAKAGAQ